MSPVQQAARSRRAERAHVRAVAQRVDDARVCLAEALGAADDPRVDRLLGRLLAAAFAGRSRRARQAILRRAGAARPSATLDALAPLLAAPTPELALHLVRAHEITRQRQLAERGGAIRLVDSPGRRRDGVYYTPPDVVRHIVDRTLGELLREHERRACAAARRGDVDAALAELATVRALRVLDPACGGGVFLLGAFERLRACYRALAAALGAAAPAALAAPGRLALAENLFGVDLDARALELAELLLLAQVADEPGDTQPLIGRALREADHLDAPHAALFPAAFARDDPGFDVIVGNPPYARPTAVQRAQARAAGYRCHDVGDLYGLFVEGLLRAGRAEVRGGLIVPLSLTYSRHFASLRARMREAPCRWQLAGYDRIPSGLFDAEVRTRTAIVVCQPGPQQVETAALRRFTAAERPRVFDGLTHVPTTGLQHPQLGFPKLGSAAQAAALSRLVAAGARLGDAVSDGPHRLHHKHNCYAFAIVAAELPPAFDAEGRPTPQTKYSSLGFDTGADRDRALAVTGGAWLLWWWLVYGDGFDLTGALIRALPIDPRGFSADARRRLAQLGARIQRRAARNVAFKANSGKRIGTFDLRACAELTRAADELVARELGAEDLLADVRAQLRATHGCEWAG